MKIPAPAFYQMLDALAEATLKALEKGLIAFPEYSVNNFEEVVRFIGVEMLDSMGVDTVTGMEEDN
jgi:hypothetical protein